MPPEAVFFVFSMEFINFYASSAAISPHFIMQITYHAIVSHLEDRCSFIVVFHSDDVIRILHTGDVLDCTGDTTGRQHLRFKCASGLSD